MADELKPPVAIRITRPYTTDTEFLEREFDTLTHTSVVLLGAQPRPQGVVLRFEIVLTTGESLLRGEGRVVGYKETAHGGEPGLSLRFTRLDARSKTVVDRASALRDARSRGAISQPLRPAGEALPPPDPPPPAPFLAPARPATRRPPPLPDWAKQAPSTPPTLGVDASLDVETTQVDPNFDLNPPHFAAAPPPEPEPEPPPPEPLPPPLAPRVPIRPTPARPPPLPRTVAPLTNLNATAPTAALPSSPPPPPVALPPPPVLEAPLLAATAFSAPRQVPGMAFGRNKRRPGPIAPPANRDALLAKLRGRARSLPPSRVDEILAKPR